MLLGLGFRPRPGELFERGRFSASPERHYDHPGDSAVLEPAGGQVAEQPHDTLVLLRVPAIVQAVVPSEPRWRILLAHDLRGDERGRTHLACREVAADTGQHDRLSIGVFRGLHLPVRVLGHDLVRDPAYGAEATNLLEIHVVQLLKEPRLLAFGELRQEVRHSRSSRPRTTPRAYRELHDWGLRIGHSLIARGTGEPRLDPPCVAHRHTLASVVLCGKVCPNVIRLWSEHPTSTKSR